MRGQQIATQPYTRPRLNDPARNGDPYTGTPRYERGELARPLLVRHIQYRCNKFSTSGLPTTRPESRTGFALCRSAVLHSTIQQSRARLTLPDLAKENREFTWVDTPDLKYSRDAKISYIPP